MCLGWISSQKWLKSNHLHPALQLIEESSHPELAARKVILTQHLIFIKVLVHVRDPLLRELKLWMRRRSKMWACGIQMSPNSLKSFFCACQAWKVCKTGFFLLGLWPSVQHFWVFDNPERVWVPHGLADVWQSHH